MRRVLVSCDGAQVPVGLARQNWDLQQSISHRGEEANLNFRIVSPAVTFSPILQGRSADLLRIAAYSFAVDQQVRRGGAADIHGDDWRRYLALCLPVSDPEFWREPTINDALVEALSFVSDDRWEFHFSKARVEAQQQVALDIDQAEALGRPDCVALLSGGLDSLCAVVEQLAVHGKRPLLIAHSPAFNVRNRQQNLRDALRKRFSRWHFPLIKASVHRKSSDAPENTQRTRSFLYATLGAVAADQLSLKDVFLADNGVVSLNLPINDQLLGAEATRSTHPKFIRLYNRLARLVFVPQPQIVNPLWNRTRAEALRILTRLKCQGLVEKTNSCSHNRGKTAMQPHCGVCSQCIDRRFATIAAGLQDVDPPERYEVDIFQHALREGPPRTMAFSYYRFAANVAELDREGLFQAFAELYDCIEGDDPEQEEHANVLSAMIRRHGETVVRVMEDQLAGAKRAIARQQLPDTCLLAMVGAQRRDAPSQEDWIVAPDYRWVTLQGETYRLTVNQSRVVQVLDEQRKNGVKGVSQAYVLEHLDIKSKSLMQVFRGSKAWGTVVVPEEGRGLYRVNL